MFAKVGQDGGKRKAGRWVFSGVSIPFREDPEHPFFLDDSQQLDLCVGLNGEQIQYGELRPTR